MYFITYCVTVRIFHIYNLIYGVIHHLIDAYVILTIEAFFQVADELVAEFADPSNSLASPDQVPQYPVWMIKILFASLVQYL